MSQAAIGVGGQEQFRYKGVRRRRWGKWVSEIRVPGTRERLWLGSYTTPEAAAVAHDSAVYFLHGGAAAAGALNFPEHAAAAHGPRPERLSPRSVQRVASETGMAADAQLVDARESALARAQVAVEAGNGIAQGGANAGHGAGYDTYTYNCTYMGENSSISGNSGTSREQLVGREFNVDDWDILM